MNNLTSTRPSLPKIHKLFGERLLSFAHAARELPGRNGNHANPSTLWRWAVTGARTPDGRRIKLERVCIGATHYTSAEALYRFFAALSEAPANAARSVPQTENQLNRRARAAGKRLEAMGIG